MARSGGKDLETMIEVRILREDKKLATADHTSIRTISPPSRTACVSADSCYVRPAVCRLALQAFFGYQWWRLGDSPLWEHGVDEGAPNFEGLQGTVYLASLSPVVVANRVEAENVIFCASCRLRRNN